MRLGARERSKSQFPIIPAHGIWQQELHFLLKMGTTMWDFNSLQKVKNANLKEHARENT